MGFSLSMNLAAQELKKIGTEGLDQTDAPRRPEKPGVFPCNRFLLSHMLRVMLLAV